MSYVDAFVVPVPKKHLKTYRALASKGAKIWQEYGALQYMECLADDVKPGKLTSYPRSLKLKSTETVVVGFVEFKSRAHRDKVTKQVMADPRIQKMWDPKKMPIDGKRMFWGGFKHIAKR